MASPGVGEDRADGVRSGSSVARRCGDNEVRQRADGDRDSRPERSGPANRRDVRDGRYATDDRAPQRRELHSLLRSGEPGVVITTVHKFAEAGHLNDRSNIVVLVDEAHRSQEGKLGDAWRAAVPNAKFFGATGTAIQDKDRSTFKLFGDPSDPDFVMSRYTPEQSIADGFTKPVVVEGRAVGFNLDKEALDEAFEELAAEEDLDEDDKVYLSGKASHIETILSNPERVAAVCADIVDHFLTYVAPLGQKAQVVAYNQRLVVCLRAGYSG